MGHKEEIGRQAAEAFETARGGIRPAKDALRRVPHPTREGLGHVVANTLWELTRVTVRHEIDDPSDYFGDARTHLADSGSLVIISNHFDRLDTTIIGHVVEQNVTPLDRITGVTSLKYLDPNRSRVISRVINNVSQVKGFSVIPVIQGLQEELDYYSEHTEATEGRTPRRFNVDAMKEAAEILNKPGEVLMIDPEGTKSPKRKLIEAHEGLDSIMKLSRRRALILPIAIVPPDTRRIVPPYTKVVVRPGALFSLEDVQQEQEAIKLATGKRPELGLTGRMMLRLAQLLPPQNQGHYRQFVNQE